MKLFPKGAWGYAVLLIILFSIAALATKTVVDFTAERFGAPEYELAVREFRLIIWLLTMGFMFLAGALGLLGMSATAEYESRHRIARIVNTMNSLSDGLLVMDYQGYLKGANSALRRLAPGHAGLGHKVMLGNIFPSLQPKDMARLLNRSSACEIEAECLLASGLRVLRFRTQPAEGLILVFVSDITEMYSAIMRQHQAAKLQLLGRIAGGVAHDFCNILSAISGHAFLMRRFSDDKRTLDESIGIIMNETQRGVRLSRQLLALSRSSDYDGQSSANLAENVREADELLRVALSSAWKIDTEAHGTFPVVALSQAQVVQIILNLGLLASDLLKKPGKLEIQLKQPDNLSADFSRFAAIITISALEGSDNSGQLIESQLQSSVLGVTDTTGVIPSVVRTLIEEAGGRLDEIYASSNRSLFRLCLPHASKIGNYKTTPLNSVIKGPVRLNKWKILMNVSDQSLEWLMENLVNMGAEVDRATAVEGLMRFLDSGKKPDVIITDKSLFGEDPNGILRLVRKICPQAGVVVASRAPAGEDLQHEKGFVFLEPGIGEDAWLDAIFRSRQAFVAEK